MSAEAAATVPAAVSSRWACPRCRAAALAEQDGGVHCGSCGADFGLSGGVPSFGRAPAPAPAPERELTVMIMALNEAGNIAVLLEQLKATLAGLGICSEVIVLDGGSTDGTPERARAGGARVIVQERRGYGRALAQGFRDARSRYVITMDADLSHPAQFVRDLWDARGRGQLVVASRFVPGAGFVAPWGRRVLSRILNGLFARVLSVPVRDFSTGFRLYHAEALRGVEITGVNFEALEEILIKVFIGGWQLAEIPFHYAPRREGASKARLIAFGVSLLKTLHRMWRLRNSIASADYDERAFDSAIPLQRYWHRNRHRVVMRWVGGVEGGVLDVGCGSSRILRDLPGAVGLDVAPGKLRLMRQRGAAVVEGDIFALPFRDGSFGAAVCSQVVEHIPAGDAPFRELARVLRPGGLVVVGTPDYGRPWWPLIEAIYRRVHPQGYADDHITHYTRASLCEHLERAGLTVLDSEYLLGAELNVLARRDR